MAPSIVQCIFAYFFSLSDLLVDFTLSTQRSLCDKVILLFLFFSEKQDDLVDMNLSKVWSTGEPGELQSMGSKELDMT